MHRTCRAEGAKIARIGRGDRHDRVAGIELRDFVTTQTACDRLQCRAARDVRFTLRKPLPDAELDVQRPEHDRRARALADRADIRQQERALDLHDIEVAAAQPLAQRRFEVRGVETRDELRRAERERSQECSEMCGGVDVDRVERDRRESPPRIIDIDTLLARIEREHFDLGAEALKRASDLQHHDAATVRRRPGDARRELQDAHQRTPSSSYNATCAAAASRAEGTRAGTVIVAPRSQSRTHAAIPSTPASRGTRNPPPCARTRSAIAP